MLDDPNSEKKPASSSALTNSTVVRLRLIGQMEA